MARKYFEKIRINILTYCAICTIIKLSGERNNTNQESEREMNVAYVNNTGADLRINGMHKAIIKAIETTGQLPEEIADLLTLTKTDIVNPDGSPRYIVDWA